ncbi:hypothetical protein IscW_ISCW009714 [Ixodes scapularis]|uniref:Uncharacterized protein n=1 Tax=Ixodes scapularis TaxID=6945 RepID=B7Q1P1_IXOSC|nr:hypothetical protein IscW_ISCW009714 [Ixodes scapularis]|eukprot:XP_002409959.1 hypothetical protein IscW_ISCW009714 [Ixodes scapularis]
MDVTVLIMNVGKDGPLSLGVTRSLHEESIFLCARACGEVRSLFWMVLAVVPVSERLGLSNQDVLPWRQFQLDKALVGAHGVLAAPPLPYQASVNPGQVGSGVALAAMDSVSRRTLEVLGELKMRDLCRLLKSQAAAFWWVCSRSRSRNKRGIKEYSKSSNNCK